MNKPFLTAEWNNLIMANYIIDPKILIPYLPPETELDFYKGDSYVSLIGFMFEQTKILGLKIPFHINFEEVNLRFYVRHNDNGVWKRGAVFIKEIVPKPAISFTANTLYREKYTTLPMKHYFRSANNEIELGYLWKYKGDWNSLEATIENNKSKMSAGSKEQFIAEHYWGYSKYNSTTAFEYGVQHPSWEIYHLKSYRIVCDFKKLYGTDFGYLNATDPDSVFVAAGSPISIMPKRNIRLQK